MPEGVRTFLNNFVGTWNFDGRVKGTQTAEWDAGKGALIVLRQYLPEAPSDISGYSSAFFRWDGTTNDGIIMCWNSSTNQGISYGETKGKVVSDSLWETQREDRENSQRVGSDVRLEFEGPNRFTWTATGVFVKGEKRPDIEIAFTRVKPTTHKDFREYCKLCQGRWMCDITWAADWPGIGKKGDTVTAYVQHTLSEDGHALISKFFGGQGSETGIWSYDASDGLIKGTVVSSGGAVKSVKVRKTDEGWSSSEVGIEPDGTKVACSFTLTFQDGGKKAIGVGGGTRGEEKFEFKNVWHKVSR